MSVKKVHCYFLSAGELRAIIGDDTDHGAGSNQHSGIWYLTSTRHPHTAVAQGNAHLVLGQHRGTGPSVRQLEDGTVELFKAAGPENNFIETRGLYRLVAPWYIDYTLEATARNGHDAEMPLEFSWCCYMNSPQHSGIHFLENGRWVYLYNPVHGQNAMVWPTGLPREKREPWGRQPANVNLDGKTRVFFQSDSGHTFDYPFYFGMIRGQEYLIMADRYRSVRFFLSPWGGSDSLSPGASNPAWDVGWYPKDMAIDKTQDIHIRVAYKSSSVKNYYQADDSWLEYQKFLEIYPCRD